MTNKRQKGAKYEQLARAYLQEKGYEIIKMNYYSPGGEIDIIARKDACMIFAEVKYRKNADFGLPGEAITKRKMAHMREAAFVYIYENQLENEDIRFDAVLITGVYPYEIEHIKSIL